MRYTNRKDAEQIVAAYLGGRFQSLADKMFILDMNETGIKGRAFLGEYGQDDCWVVYVPDIMARSTLSPSRIICIQKMSGAVVYDGSEGGISTAQDKRIKYSAFCSPA
jgi:hypothetical protein